MSTYLELVDGSFALEHLNKQKNQNPYVAYSIDDETVIYTIIPNYLCLEPLDSNNQLALAKMGDYSNIQYSFDKSNWNDFTTDPTNPLNITFINVDKPIYLRGNSPNGILNQELLVGCKLLGIGKYNVSGDATTLLNEVGLVRDLTPYGEQSLITLFGSISSGISGLPIDLPSVDIVDASQLVLPSITLSFECYLGMFRDCTSLVDAPLLPAIELAEDCYQEMFEGCTSLMVAPHLPATTLVSGCYRSMFDGCTKLSTAPELPATTLANYCYYNMFYNCTSLIAAPELPATTLADRCYDSMFMYCTSLTTAPALPATTLAYQCYRYMFVDCRSLTTAPELPATTLSDRCYVAMFGNCTSLTTAPKILPATDFYGGNCYLRMFQGCSSLTTAPELPATTLEVNCYQKMFDGCKSLNYIKCLATDISASNCTNKWVSGVSSTGIFVKHPNMNNWTTGTNGIPNGWTVEDAVL